MTIIDNAKDRVFSVRFLFSDFDWLQNVRGPEAPERGIGHGSLRFALVLILSCPGLGLTELVYIVASHMSSLQIAFCHH